MRKVDDGEEKRKKKRLSFLVATTSLPAVYRPNDAARTTTAGMPHAHANLTKVDFLDVTFALDDGTYKPFTKPNNIPQYTTTHPQC